MQLATRINHIIFRHMALIALFIFSVGASADILDEVEHGYADNNGVKIHYATVGEGPLVIMVHGFPDYWYSWRHQMEGLKDSFKVVAIDQRAYNLSDKPEGEENYSMRYLISDIAAVIHSLGEEKATIVGHDWGGVVSWQFAFALPQMVENLVILNLPHPNGMARELANNQEQQQNSGYARAFIAGKSTDPDIFFGGPMNPQSLSGWVSDPAAREHYIEAFGRSSFDGMLAYYKQNYPRGGDSNAPAPPAAPQLTMPVLIFHGLKDTALHSDGLNNTWDWIDADTTIVTAPNASHFVQQDAAELVTSTLKWWLLARQ
ncbi:MAG: alpha/beta hydrolase [SAR86 cluster bacterium]|uniref:Alpha/beta hydrolase n=1 Tax=SAR86 cluster bacterium TaxID=2030880 RepID=A0A2A5B6Z8_9GAMM|nr:MAG: alpha/beta hydrolase [SAR86 cluster bacterium]